MADTPKTTPIATNHFPLVVQHLDGKADEQFKAVIRRLTNRNVPYFVTGGTLLGLVRDGHLIDSDTDIDVSVDGAVVSEEQVREAFADWRLARELRLDGDIQQLVYYPDGIIVDVHFYRPENGPYVCHHLAGRLVFSAGMFTGATTLTTKLGEVRVPKNPAAYLTSKYGWDWAIPKYQKKGQYA